MRKSCYKMLVKSTLGCRDVITKRPRRQQRDLFGLTEIASLFNVNETGLPVGLFLKGSKISSFLVIWTFLIKYFHMSLF